jgi:hypothetical protein
VEIMQVIIITSAFISTAVWLGITITAYSRREDRSFWGGSNMLTGWFFLFPYGQGGVPGSERKLVFWYRVVAVITWFLWGLAYVFKQ